MTSPARHSWLAGSTYFVLLLLMAIWARDIPGQFDASHMTLQGVIQTSTMGDPASFAKAALDIAENGWLSSSNDWIFNLWPPGFVLLEALIVKLLGQQAPVLVVLQVLAVLLHTAVLLQLANFLKRVVNTRLAYILPMLVFLFPVSRVFLLQPTGISLGESFSIGFFLVGFFLMLQASSKNSTTVAICSGVFLALSAYFRSQFEIILLALAFWTLMISLVYRFVAMAKPGKATWLVTNSKAVVVAIVTAHAVMLPWRAYHWIYQGSPQWVQTASVTFGNAVQTSDFLEKHQGGFVVEGGGNLVCRIDPSTCGDVVNAKGHFIKTFFANPFEWYTLKLEVIGKYWYSSIRNWSSVGAAPSSMDVIINGVLLLALCLVPMFLFSRTVRIREYFLALLLMNLSLYSAYLLIFTAQQFEVRYFYFPKIIGVIFFILLASIRFGKSEAKPVADLKRGMIE
jgi:hypothetical protein